MSARFITATSIAGAVHLASSLVLLAVIANVSWGVYGLLIAIVGLTAIAALALVQLSMRRSVSRVVRLTPVLFGVLPPIASVLLGAGLVLASEQSLVEVMSASVALLGAATAPGVAIALNLEHILAGIRARYETPSGGPGSESGARSKSLGREPPTLAGRLRRLVAGLALGLSLLAIAELLALGGVDALLADGRGELALLALASVVVAATVAASGAGSSPGRDLQTLARRLDAIGVADEQAHDGQLSRIVTQSALRPLDSVVRVTSFDAVGELFAHLEDLRGQLEENVGSYQRALEKTHAVDAAKREFLAAVSHELRTPLNSILGFGQLLLEAGLNDEQADDVRLILAGGHQLRDLIEDILDLSMIESGELELHFSTCEPDEFVGELVDIHQAQVREGVVLRADVRGSIPAIECDRRRIGQVITNLLSNALKFTESGEVVVGLRFEPQESNVVISVRDTGVGIAEDELDAIFQEYQQVGENKRKIKGTGLGLAIARRIAEAHGGRLSATSVLDEGSTFSLRLPLEPPEGSAGTWSVGGRR